MAFDAGSSNPARDAFLRGQGLDPARLRFCVQIHSRDVLLAGDRPAGEPGRADGLAAISPDMLLSVTVADCLPVALFDTEHRAFALVHSGWKGTGIARVALSLMGRTWGTRPEAVAAVLGPCIRSCCYRVDEERAAAFEAEFGGAGAYPLGPVVERTERDPRGREPQPRLNLQAANASILAEAGVRELSVCGNCTYTDERLGSFRREGPEHYTRMVAVAGRLGVNA